MKTLYFKRQPEETAANFIYRIYGLIDMIPEFRILSVIIEKNHASLTLLKK